MADISKMTEATGWEPRISFREGLRRICEQYT
jgi:UDP-glucose 4-epimerase